MKRKVLNETILELTKIGKAWLMLFTLPVFIIIGWTLAYVIGGSTAANIFIYQIINGIIMGVLYGLMAIGLSLIWGIMKLCNFAHGEFYTMAAYLCFYIFTIVKINPAISLIISILLVFLVGLLIEPTLLRVAYYTENPHYAWLATFGLSMFIQNLFLLVFGPFPKKPPSILTGTLIILGMRYPVERIIAAVIAATLIIVLFIVIKITWYGRALRAMVQDREAATMMGIDVERMTWFSFGLGIALAGSAGTLLGSIFLIDPMAGARPCLKAFVVVVLGGMGSLRGSAIGGLILGIVESLGAAYISPGYMDAFGFILLVLTLIIKPTGLFGGKL